jgi:hypothetical protein
LTDAQIQTSAQGQLSPLIQQLTDSLNRQAQAGGQAITGYTSQLAQQLAPFQQSAANIYGGAQQSQAASDAALSQKLSGEGGQQAQDLGARLASINAPGAVNAAVGQGMSDATGSGNALYATGSASLANLIASGAAEQSYAAKQPGLAGLAGEQQIGGLQSSIANSLASGTDKINAQAPGIVSGLQSDRSALLGRKEALRGDLASFFDTRAAKQQALAQERQAFGLKAATAQTSAQQKQQALQISQQNANTSASRAAKANAPTPPKVNTTQSAANGYLTDGSGNAIKKNGKNQPYTPAPSKSAVDKKATHGLTPQAYQTATTKAQGLAAIAHKSYTDPKTKIVHPGLTWLQFMRGAQAKGIPTWAIIQEGQKIYSEAERKNGLIPKG